MLVRSAGLGYVGLQVIPFGFEFHRWCHHFGQIRQDLARSWRELTGSQRDLARSRQIWTRSRWDLAVSCPIWWVSSKFSPENAGFCMFSPENSKYRWKFLVICSGQVAWVLGEETRQPTHRCRVLWAATRHRLSEWSVQAVFDSSSGGFLGLVEFRVGLDSPSINRKQ